MNFMSKSALSWFGIIGLMVGAFVLAATFKTGIFAERQPAQAETSKTPTNSNSGSDPESSSSTKLVGDCSTPIFADMTLQFAAGMQQHLGELEIRGCSGKMTVTYFNSETEQVERISQTMELHSTSRGLLLVGSNPVYVGTDTPASSYSADNFLFSRGIHGDYEIMNCDDRRVCSTVEIRDYQERDPS